jgi:hypothetical protein
MTKTTCSRCMGKGIIEAFRHIDGGQCFRCLGRGFLLSEKIAVLQKKYRVFIKMSAEADISPWYTGEAPSIEKMLTKAKKIAMKGCYKEFIGSIIIEEMLDIGGKA